MLKYKDVRRIHFELSTFCNARCPNCPRNVEGGYTIPSLIQKSITLAQFKKIIPSDFLKQIEMFNFCGNYGDPIFCKDLPEILNYISEFNPNCYIEIHTNGGHRSVEWWESLAIEANKLTNCQVVFSIDGLEDTNHIYRRDVDWNNLQSNVASYINAGGYATWEYLIFKHNEHQIDEARLLSMQLGFKEFNTKRAFGFDQKYNAMRVIDKNGDFQYYIYEPSDSENINKISDTATVTPDTYNLPAESYATVIDDTKRNFNNLYQSAHSNTNSDDNVCISCYSFETKEIYIDASGIVYPCCWLGHASQDSNPSLNNIQFITWMEKNVDKNRINALKWSIEVILDNTVYFNKIALNWKLSNSEGKLQTCVRMCNSNKNLTDLLYKEKIKNEIND